MRMLLLKAAVLFGFAVAAGEPANTEVPKPETNAESNITTTTTTAAPSFLFADDAYVQEIPHYGELLKVIEYPLNRSITPTLKVSSDDDVMMVMFYADWCPHCHRAAPVWHTVANMYHCTPGVRFFAFECSQNTPDRTDPVTGKTPLQTCMEFGVKSYPTFYAFTPDGIEKKSAEHPLSSEEAAAKHVEFAGADEVDAVSSITTRMIFQQNDAKEFNLVGFNVTNDDDDNDNQVVVLQQKIVLALRSVSSFRAWITQQTSIKDVVRCVLRGDFVAPTAAPLPVSGDTIVYHLDRWDATKEAQSTDLFYADALNAFLYLLQNWVLDDEAEGLSPQRNLALQRILNVSAALLPGSNIRSELHDFATRLAEKDGNIKADVYLNMVKSIDLGGLRAPSKPGIKPEFYHLPRISSALWLYFHILSAGYYVAEEPELAAQLMHVNATNSTMGIPELTGWEVAQAVRDTVDNFFGCDVCRVHFLTFFDRCYAGLCDWVKKGQGPLGGTDADGLLLWVWRFHNAVTFRTAVERTSDMLVSEDGVPAGSNLVSFEGQDVRYPHKHMCEKCRLETNNTSSVTVSKELLEKAVAWERMIRGYDTGDFAGIQAAGDGVDSAAWDRIEDFDLVQIQAYLLQRYWKPEWSDRDAPLYWKDTAFGSSANLRRLFITGENPRDVVVACGAITLPLSIALFYWSMTRGKRHQIARTS